MEHLNFTKEGLNRRVFIKDIGWITFGLFAGLTLGGCEGCSEQIRNRPLRRRLRTGSSEVDQTLDLYREAIRLMKERSSNNPSDPIGWSAQAAIHGSNSGGFNLCQHGTNHFFSWHRAYLVWFERICQKLSGDDKFGLLYWNWNQDPAIHPDFLDSNSVLYMPRTRTTMAGQSQVSTSTLDLIFSDHNFFTFSSQLEGTPHNRVHSWTGGDFGGGGSAADPIFWMHHCMVDYCWAKWNLEMGNDNTNDSAWLNTKWNHFYDSDGNVTETSAAATILMPLLSYRYESSAIGSNPAQAESSGEDFKKLEARVRKGANIKFDIRRRIPLSDTATLSIARPFQAISRADVSEFSKIIGSDKTSETIFARIGYASLPPFSDFFVRVFINHPKADANTPITDPHYAGSFAFFGTQPKDQTHGGHHDHQPEFLVNITPTIERLRKSGDLKDDSQINLQLVAVPNGEQFTSPEATLRLTKVELIVTPVIVPTDQKQVPLVRDNSM